MKTKKLGRLFLVLLLIVFSACGSKKNVLEGYWMAENGETLSFNSEGRVVVNDTVYDYAIFDGDKVTISHSLWGLLINAQYEVNDEILTLKDMRDGTVFVFYGEKKQQERITDSLLKQEQEIINRKAEEERREQEQAERAKYEQYITSLWNELRILEEQIENNKTRIDELQDMLNECENEIESNRKNGDLAEDKIDRLREKQEIYRDEISFRNEDIAYYEEKREEIIGILKDNGEW